MTDTVKSRKLSHEILALIALSAGISLVLFLLLSNLAVGLAERYCFQNDIPMTEFDWMAVDRWIFGISAVLSCVSFSVLFLFLLRDRIDYIRKITAGIDRLHQPESSVSIPLEGNNELTALAASINEMSRTRQRLQEKERALAAEKEQLIRALSHDIRTPLTAILSYSDFLAGRDEITPADRDAYLATIRKKAEQIRDLTAVLLDGSRRVTAVLLTTLTFALMHGNAAVLPSLLAASTLLTLLMLQSGRIAVPVTAHLVFNLTALIRFDIPLWGSVLAGVLLIALAACLIARLPRIVHQPMKWPDGLIAAAALAVLVALTFI